MITDISTIDVKRIARRVYGLKNKSVINPNPMGFDMNNILKLDEYRQYWDSLADLRRRYQRACRFNRGDQWSDLIEDDNGNTVREDTYIRSQGKLPLKQNIIRPTTKALAGLFRSEKGKSIVQSRKPNSTKVEKMLSNALQYALHINEAREIDPRTFDMFLLSGLPIQKIGYDFLSEYGRYDITLEYIDPSYIFFNSDIKDVTLKDLRVIGQLHDITFDELFVHFAQTDEDKTNLKNLYAGVTEQVLGVGDGLSSRRTRNIDFYTPLETHKCRVIEVWEKRAVNVIEYWDPAAGEEGIWQGTLRSLMAINEARAKQFISIGLPEDRWSLIRYKSSVAFKWFYKFITPLGHILREGETPYAHNSHPFVMYPYPLVNGEVWGPVEDIIDQQKYINRLVTMWDFIMGTSAKNTLFIEEGSTDKTPEELGEDYRKVGSVIMWNSQKGVLKPPFESSGRLPNLGITELIGLQLKWLQDISGVQPAIQGQTPTAGTPSSRYAQEAMNASNNSRDLLESFAAFRRRRDFKVLKTIIQFYKTERYLAINGKDDENFYDPALVEGMANEFDLVIGQSTDSPTYKSWVDETLLEFVKAGLIDIKLALPHLSLPFADALLEDIKAYEEQLTSGQINPSQAIQGMSNSYLQKSGVDPNQINRIYDLVRKDAA